MSAKADSKGKNPVKICDTTFRDGQQAGPPYNVEQMVRIYDLLSRLGGPNGVIRQTEFFPLYKKMP
jgi:isopropylmalate/homocitrate/citramalate synthase